MSHDDMIGGVLDGKYELTGHIATGRYTDVWAANRLADGQQVSVKLLQPELYMDDEAMARYQREIKLLLGWHHDGLFKLLEHGVTPQGVPWIAAEWEPGRHLSDDISDLALDIDDVCEVAEQIARVLGSAHDRGIVHRGLGPDAIYIIEKADGLHVKVLDFGLAHLTEQSGEEQITQIGQRLGALEYSAPEYILDTVLDARADIYVLGILVFEMLAGQPPFVGSSMTVMNNQVYKDPPRASELSMLEVPSWLDELLLEMLAKDPAKRPSPANAVGDAFALQRWPL